MYANTTSQQQDSLVAARSSRSPAEFDLPLSHVNLELSEYRTRMLRRSAQDLGLTVENVVQTAWLILLESLTAAGRLDQAMPVVSLMRGIKDHMAAEPIMLLGQREIDSRVRMKLRGDTNAALSVTVRLGRQVTLRVKYVDGDFDRGAAEQIAECLLRVLEAIIVGPDQPICRVEALGDEDRLRIGGMLADLTTRELTVPELIGDQVARNPDAVAITYGDVTMTYSELDAQANRLAHRLIEHGAGTVVLDMSPSPELVIALLAALKSGTACLASPGHIRSRTDSTVLTELGDLEAFPDHRPPRVPSAYDLVGVSCATGDCEDGHDDCAPFRHGDLVSRLLTTYVQHDLPRPMPSLIGSFEEVLCMVFQPLIAGAVLAIKPDAMAAVRRRNSDQSIREPGGDLLRPDQRGGAVLTVAEFS